MMPEKKFGDILNFDQSSQNIQIHFRVNMIWYGGFWYYCKNWDGNSLFGQSFWGFIKEELESKALILNINKCVILHPNF